MVPDPIQLDLDAAAGRVLAADLRDGAGHVLVAGGTVLADSMLQSLRRRGIASVQVEAPPDSAAAAAECERRCVRIEQLFRHSAAIGATAELMARLAHYRRSLK